MATLAIPQEIRNAAPEFATLTDPQIQDFIDMADAEINPDAWGSRAKLAEIALTCHLMTAYGALGKAQGGAAGPIASVRVGEVAVTYAMINPLRATNLSTTRYGLEYERLQHLAAYGAEVL